jgi:hypothetical protein
MIRARNAAAVHTTHVIANGAFGHTSRDEWRNCDHAICAGFRLNPRAPVPTGFAIASLVLEFRSGPQSTRFYACPLHVVDLPTAGGGLFFRAQGSALEPVNPDDEMTCDLCREG